MTRARLLYQVTPVPSERHRTCRAIIASALGSLLLVTAGCAGVSYFTYQPVSQEERRTETRPGGEGSFMEYTQYFWERELGDGVTMNLAVDATSRPSVTVRVWAILQDGSTFAMKSGVINIATDDTAAEAHALGEFRLSVYGRDGDPGYFIRKRPTEQIRYTGLNDWWLKTGIDRYVAEVVLEIDPPSQIILTLPGLTINGEEYLLQPIVFSRRDLDGKFKLN